MIKILFFKELKLWWNWLFLIILLIIYSIIFNVSFFIVNSKLVSNNYYIDSEYFLLIKQTILKYCTWFLFYFITPIIIIYIIYRFKSYSLYTYYFTYEILNFYSVIILYLKLIFSNLLFYLFFIILFLFTFVTLNIWTLDKNGYTYFLKLNLVLIIVWLIYFFVFENLFLLILILTKPKIAFSILISIFIISIMLFFISNSVTNNLFNDSTNYKYLNSLNKEESINISNKELILLNEFQSNEIYDNNFKISELNKENKIDLLKYEKFLINYCPTYDLEVFIYNNNLNFICKVNESKINDAYNQDEEINLIWKNSIQNIEAKEKFEKIILEFQNSENFEELIQIVKTSLNDIYKIRNEYLLEDVISRIFFNNNGIKLSGTFITEKHYETLNDFLKNIFYYYLKGYMYNSLEIDKITKRTFIEIFTNFLYTNIFNKNVFNEILNNFMWGFINIESYNFKDFKELFLTPSFFIDIVNTNGISKNNWEEINKDINKFQLWSLLNFNNYFTYLLNYITVLPNEKEYEIKLITVDEKKQPIDLFQISFPNFNSSGKIIVMQKAKINNSTLIIFIFYILIFFYLLTLFLTIIIFYIWIYKQFIKQY